MSSDAFWPCGYHLYHFHPSSCSSSYYVCWMLDPANTPPHLFQCSSLDIGNEQLMVSEFSWWSTACRGCFNLCWCLSFLFIGKIAEIKSFIVCGACHLISWREKTHWEKKCPQLFGSYWCCTSLTWFILKFKCLCLGRKQKMCQMHVFM